MMMLGNRQLAMQHHPVYQVRQLAQSATDSLRRSSLRYGQSLFVTFPFGGTPHLSPYRERLTRSDQQSVDMLHCQGEVDRFVFLQLHVDITQPAANQGVVAIDQDGQWLLCPFVGKRCLSDEVSQMTFQYLFLHRQPVGEG